MSLVSSQNVQNKLKDWLAQGQWKYGQALPKFRVLCEEWQISASTLLSALQQLEKENLTYKKGKAWVAGSPISTTEPTKKSQQPMTILLVSHHLHEWTEFYKNLFAGFVISFGFEANRHQVRLYPVLTGEKGEEHGFPCGRKAIQQFRKELGSSYLGAVFTPLSSETKDVNGDLNFLSKLGGPVVWMQDEHPNIFRKLPPTVLRISFGDWGNRPGNSSAYIALESLYIRGHRKIAFVSNGKGEYNWMEQRWRALKNEEPNFTGLQLEPLIWGPQVSDIMLMQRVMDRVVTGVIVPNDDMAIRYYKAWLSLGKTVPQDLSMVSFDNRFTLMPYPISSVDFGLELLGYQAFHHIFGVLPIHTGKRKQLFGHNQLKDNGSIQTANSKVVT